MLFCVTILSKTITQQRNTKMKSFQEKSNIALEMVARAKLVNLQETYNDDGLMDTMEEIEKTFVTYIEDSLANQDFYELFLDWLRANIKELIAVETSTDDIYIIANIIDGVREVDLDTFYEYSTYQKLNEIQFYNSLDDGGCEIKCIFTRDSDVLENIIHEYGIRNL